MGDLISIISMSISVDSPSDETFNRGPLALLFPFWINVVQFYSLFFFKHIGHATCSVNVSDTLSERTEQFA